MQGWDRGVTTHAVATQDLQDTPTHKHKHSFGQHQSPVYLELLEG